MGFDTSKIASLRHGDSVDFYTVDNGKIIHFYSNKNTNFQYKHQAILPQYTAASNIAAICYLDYIDIYFIDNKSRLCHAWTNSYTNWKHQSQIILPDVDSTVDPIAMRYYNAIDIYCVTKDKRLIHLYGGDYSNWEYQCSQIRRSDHKIGGLSAIRVSDSIDIYFIENNILYHANAKSMRGWKYHFQAIAHGHFKFKTISIRHSSYIDVFAVENSGRLVQYFANPFTFWNYRKYQIQRQQIFADYFTVIRYKDHIDLYFVDKDLNIKHTYCGKNSIWSWNYPNKISQFKSTSDLSIIRNDEKIDLYYFGQDWNLINSSTGQGTKYGWSKYQSKKINNINHFPTKEKLQWQNIKGSTKLLGSGYHSQAFLCKNLSIVIKKYKNPYIKMIQNEVEILNKKGQKNQENLCKFILYQGPKIIGISMPYYQGKVWDDLLKNKKSIFHKNINAKIKLILKLAKQVVELQKLDICHGDIHLNNIVINVYNEQDRESEFDVKLIDYGNSIDFGKNCLTHSGLTGWKFLLPPQVQKKPYNPKGVNPYQFACICVHILEDIPYSEYKNQAQTIQQKIKQIQKKYPKQLMEILIQLTSDKADNRIKCLYQNFQHSQKVFNDEFIQKILHLDKQNNSFNWIFSKLNVINHWWFR